MTIGTRTFCGWVFTGLALTASLAGAPAAKAQQPVPTAVYGQDEKVPDGFTAIFNGRDLSGWTALETQDPRKFAALAPEEKVKLLERGAEAMAKFWRVENGAIVNDGEGPYLTTLADYRDFELFIDYATVPGADSGIYLKATPQVQIWDYTEAGGKWNIGANFGSGGLWNNSPGAAGKDPLVLADRPLGEWNRFRIRQIGSRTWIWLNEKLVVDGAIMENYWDRKLPLAPEGPIQLQTHGGRISWKNVFVREIPAEEANEILQSRDRQSYDSIFNGQDFSGWKGPIDNYEIVDGAIRCKAGAGGTIYTESEYDDFSVRLQFKLPLGGNNGLAIRYPGSGDTAYVGMCELQVLDNEHPKYARLDPRQYHGSAYGMVAAHRGYLRPAGDWNFQEVTVVGSKIRVELNGTVILDCDLSEVTEFMSENGNPGKDRKSGHFGFAGHNDPVEFQQIEIRKID